jgi:hypothetical protein
LVNPEISRQQELFSGPSSDPGKPQPAASPKRADSPAPVWLQRLSIVILVVFCFYVGLLMVVLPWTRYWNGNHFLLTIPGLAQLMNSGITRGVISGLGLLDLWIGISEIIHYREYRS